jgi:hypothetical protein
MFQLRWDEHALFAQLGGSICDLHHSDDCEPREELVEWEHLGRQRRG